MDNRTLVNVRRERSTLHERTDENHCSCALNVCTNVLRERCELRAERWDGASWCRAEGTGAHRRTGAQQYRGYGYGSGSPLRHYGVSILQVRTLQASLGVTARKPV